MLDTHAKILKQQIKFDVGGDSPSTSRAASPVNRAVSPTTIPRASYDRYPSTEKEDRERMAEGRHFEQAKGPWLRGSQGEGSEGAGEGEGDGRGEGEGEGEASLRHPRRRGRRRRRRRRRTERGTGERADYFGPALGEHTISIKNEFK